MRDLPEHLWHGSYSRRANRRVADGVPTEKRGGAPAGIRRLMPQEPSKAITGAAVRDFIHYAEDRALTLRECARLQTFDDDFVFAGTPAERIQQIGNSVPPLLAHRVALHLREQLRRGGSSGGAGELLSFQPTASEGMSPALKRTCDLVKRLFGERAFAAQEDLLLWNS
jgi:DNA (cytosine-5)-methyltransferase 1